MRGGRRRLWTGALVAAPVLAGCAIFLPGLVLANLGMIDLRDALLAARGAPAASPPDEAAPRADPARAQRAARRLGRAAGLPPNRQAVWWGLGRAYLATGEFDKAAAALAHMRSAALGDDLAFADALVAFGYGGRPEEAAGLADARPERVRLSPVLAAAASFAYRAAADRGSRTAEEAARAILAVRPEDVWAGMVEYRRQAAGGRSVRTDALRRELAAEAAPPDNGRLLLSQADVILELLRAGIWNAAKARHIAAWLAWQHPDARAAGQALARLHAADPDRVVWPLYHAALMRRAGELDAAEAALQEVLRASPDDPEVRLGLARVAEARAGSSGVGQATHWAEAAQRFADALDRRPGSLALLARFAAACEAAAALGAAPAGCVGDGVSPSAPARPWMVRWLEALRHARPSVPVDLDAGNGWRCRGYDIDEDALVRGEPADLLVFWSGPADAVPGPAADGWWRTASGWVQVLQDVRSLVTNGGFELGMDLGKPRGFPVDIYVTDPGVRGLAGVERAGVTTTAGVLSNSGRDRLSSLASANIPVREGRVYLQAGWVKSIGGNGYFGRCFYRTVSASRYDAEDSYVQRDFRGETWQHLSGAFLPPPRAQWVQVRLLNYFSTGQLLFDDTWLVAADLPAPVREHPVRR